MSGSWERLKYDTDAYVYGLKENEKQINYTINRPKVCEPCRQPRSGYIGEVGVSISENRPLVDVESDLKNMDRLNSDCPSKKYKPFCPEVSDCDNGYPCGGGVVAGCVKSQEKNSHLPECDFMPTETRVTHPICTYRGLNIDRFDSLCIDPQDRGNWEHPSEVNISYRMVVKDNHRACQPKLIDQTPLLPTGGDMPCHAVKENVCANFVGDLRPNRFSKHPLE